MSTITIGQFEGTPVNGIAYGGAVASGHAVKHDASATATARNFSLAGNAETPEGIACNGATTPAAGDAISVYKSGKGKAVVLAASPNIAAGDWLGPDTGGAGKLVKITSGWAIAQALEPATADNVEIDVFIQQTYLGA